MEYPIGKTVIVRFCAAALNDVVATAVAEALASQGILVTQIVEEPGCMRLTVLPPVSDAGLLGRHEFPIINLCQARLVGAICDRLAQFNQEARELLDDLLAVLKANVVEEISKARKEMAEARQQTHEFAESAKAGVAVALPGGYNVKWFAFPNPPSSLSQVTNGEPGYANTDCKSGFVPDALLAVNQGGPEAKPETAPEPEKPSDAREWFLSVMGG